MKIYLVISLFIHCTIFVFLNQDLQPVKSVSLNAKSGDSSTVVHLSIDCNDDGDCAAQTAVKKEMQSEPEEIKKPEVVVIKKVIKKEAKKETTKKQEKQMKKETSVAKSNSHGAKNAEKNDKTDKAKNNKSAAKQSESSKTNDGKNEGSAGTGDSFANGAGDSCDDFIEKIQSKIMEYWFPSAELTARADLSIDVEIDLDSAGNIRNYRIVTPLITREHRILANSVIRTLRDPRILPLPIKNNIRKIILKFCPKNID